MTLFPIIASAAESRHRIGPVDLRLEGVGCSVVLGPNGSGKTSLLHLFHGLARLTSGTISFAIDEQAARKQQAFVFQRPVMLRRNVRENIAYPLQIRGMGRAAALARASDWGERIGLGDLLDHRANRLSGGEQQKLALARALIAEPQFLFLDEPTASLDEASKRVIETMLTEARSRGMQIILATHDFGQARRLANEVVFLHQGRVIEHSPAAAFFDKPENDIAAAFLRGDIID